eukprot:GSMAST32.ASY1.ANO1.1179.1 assembled CDS
MLSGKTKVAKTTKVISRIAVGTTNKCKVGAVIKTIQEYPHISNAEVVAFKAPSGVSEQPMGIETTAQGARNRAEAAWNLSKNCDVALGIESGLFKLDDGSYYDVCVCSSFDGNRHHLGMSCAFEVPSAIMKFVQEDDMDLSQACNASGITSDPRLGEHGGLIAILTNDRVTRGKYTNQAIRMALIHTEKSQWM